MALRIRATSPVYCGKCGKPRGILHTCVVRRSRGRTRLKAPKVMLASCPRCGSPYANPFTHVCQGKRGDFKRRKAAAERRERRRKREQLAAQRKAERAARRAAGGAQPRAQHNYQTCADEDCRRLACRAYSEGYEAGADAAEAQAERTG